MHLPETVVVGTDFSESAVAATRHAIALARKLGARVHLVHAWTMPVATVPVSAPLDMQLVLPADLRPALAVAAAEGIAREVAARLAEEQGGAAAVAIDGVAVEGDARDVLAARAAELHAGLVVVGTHGRRGIRRALLGSVAESVVRAAPCPVLVVR